jgi:hypothetical protein
MKKAYDSFWVARFIPDCYNTYADMMFKPNTVGGKEDLLGGLLARQAFYIPCSHSPFFYLVNLAARYKRQGMIFVYPLLEIPLFHELKEESFSAVQVDEMGVACWNDVTGIAPNELYNNSKSMVL